MKKYFNVEILGEEVSIYGGIVAFNRPVDKALAKDIMAKKVFLEIIMAPAYTDEAKEVLAKKTNCRVMVVDMESPFKDQKQALTVNGGLLYQDLDNDIWNDADLKVVTKKQPTEAEMKDLLFAMKCVKHVKSNAILVAANETTAGVGAGQMNRVGAAKIAIEEAHSRGVKDGLVLASDAFFPFSDTLEYGIENGVVAVVQPGGSKKDQDSIDLANEKNVPMAFTGMRHFKH
jgi:phosphoribosylaminoimidazolecarboxamide formyltransferase/IMP cyclohydrolase